jgi:MFS transporter, NNP family, nitrate/nitrite transporter
LGGVAVVAGLLATKPALAPAVVLLFVLVGAFGVGNGAVFQLVGRRYPANMGPATGLVGAAGGVGGFLLVSGFGTLADTTGTFVAGFAVLAVVSLLGALAARARERTWQSARTLEVAVG